MKIAGMYSIVLEVQENTRVHQIGHKKCHRNFKQNLPPPPPKKNLPEAVEIVFF